MAVMRNRSKDTLSNLKIDEQIAKKYKLSMKRKKRGSAKCCQEEVIELSIPVTESRDRRFVVQEIVINNDSCL